MLDVFGERQQELLRALHRNKSGLTIDELATVLDVTRTAVKQHLVALEQSGFVEKGSLKLTRGRPSRAFLLSARGDDLFPKQYSWFSGLIIRAIKAERGSEGLAEHLRELARSIASAFKGRVESKQGLARTAAIVEIMNELAYEADVTAPSESDTQGGISANNCVYHHLAKEFPEVCEFDLELLKQLGGASVDHQECILRGSNACRFAFRAPRKDKAPS